MSLSEILTWGAGLLLILGSALVIHVVVRADLTSAPTERQPVEPRLRRAA